MSTFGRFNDNGREYIIESPLKPVRHLVNFSWNNSVISGVNQFGTGEGVFNNQTLLYNDPQGRARMIRDGRRYIYIKDEESEAYWNIGYYPVKHEPFKLTTLFGTGYSKFIHETEEIKMESLCFTAHDEPVEIWRISITNISDRSRKLKLYSYVEWLLQGYTASSDYYAYIKSEYYEDINAIVGYNLSDERPHQRYCGFVASNIKASGYTGSAREFMGTYGEPSRPENVIRGRCSNRPTCQENLAGVLEIPVQLEKGQQMEVVFIIGNTTENLNETHRIVKKVLNNNYIDETYNNLLREKEKIITHTTISTPDEKINNLVNIWSKVQVQLCAEFGRDGVRGFRDTLQDAWAILSFNPELAKSKICEALSYQMREGWGVRGWMPINPRRYSDGPIWITPAVTEYIKYTGDMGILDETVPFYDGGEGTVLEHMLNGIRHLNKDRGEHGLCLAHRGDWNDSIDWMGKDGRGESVMTTMGHYRCLKLFEELAVEVLKDEQQADEMRKAAQDIRNAVETYAWDGEWYLAGYSDFGNKVGSAENGSGKIYITPQAWAVYSGIASEERMEKCFKSVEEILEKEHGCLTCYPAFTRKDENVGRMTVILPGTYENASYYCHGTAFMIAADLMAGRASNALRLYRKVLPDNDNHPSDISGAEPYAFTNQYLGPDSFRHGTSVSGWITGTAGWMYKIMINYFFGFQPGYKGVYINPCIPDEWNEVSMSTTLRGKRYDISISGKGIGRRVLLVNGRELKENFIPYKQ